MAFTKRGFFDPFGTPEPDKHEPPSQHRYPQTPDATPSLNPEDYDNPPQDGTTVYNPLTSPMPLDYIPETDYTVWEHLFGKRK